MQWTQTEPSCSRTEIEILARATLDQRETSGVFHLILQPGIGLRLSFQDPELFEEDVRGPVRHVAALILTLSRKEPPEGIRIDVPERPQEIRLGHPVPSQERLDLRHHLGAGVVNLSIANSLHGLDAVDEIDRPFLRRLGRKSGAGNTGGSWIFVPALRLLRGVVVPRRGLSLRGPALLRHLLGDCLLVFRLCQQPPRGQVRPVLYRAPLILVGLGVHETAERVVVHSHFLDDARLRPGAVRLALIDVLL
mmetsp:Transcript_41027/g.87408  ORF Transcript_41027/g.87408 Transcript_41027/m.87408 type:complete len:250 (-) Transcript_41027:637-1386(-)